MTRRKHEIGRFFSKYWAYLLSFAVIVAVAYFGSRGKEPISDDSTNIHVIFSNNYTVTADQVSEFYVVSEIANAMQFVSSNEITNNYISVALLQETNQTIDDISGKISKPTIVDVSHISRGVKSYTVQPGETLDQIASRFGVSTDQIRWSNGMASKNISEGQSLYIPTVSGIAVTVKDDDTVESLADHYGAKAADIISYNDLETNQNLKAGLVILIPNGVMPETERPEYVAPVVATPQAPQTYTYTYQNYSYIGSSGGRENLRIVQRFSYAESVGDPGNRNTPGQCTWYAWYYRKHYTSSPLPATVLGNANAWAYSLSRMGFAVNNTPSVGAVFQTTSGYYGHVGVVTSVNKDGSITVREMNYSGMAFTVTESNIPKQYVGMYNYIH
ncbi:MAG: LysM peptidoglycan-binding domain-containing protein [Candidatus Saccharibacteria bacterium]|nr:LysM peptidoglycan-binding domain-containing protein [Candidatus Saccharibacteria bacterium]